MSQESERVFMRRSKPSIRSPRRQRQGASRRTRRGRAGPPVRRPASDFRAPATWCYPSNVCLGVMASFSHATTWEVYMSEHKSAEVSEAEIAVHWQEEAQIHPSKKFVAQANLVDQRIFDRFSLDNFPDYFKEYTDLLDWYKRWDVMLDTSNPT